MISVFTPSHDSEFLPKVLESLQAQTYTDWQWIVVHNNGGEPFDCKDPRVKQVLVYKAPQWVGPLKALACEHATGDILLELDHDDLLLPTALMEAQKAFDDPKVGFAYSNALHCDGEFGKVERFLDAHGWKYRRTKYKGFVLDEPLTFEPTPASLAKIWYAPNHFRAFRRDVYEKIGGYARNMRVLDDQDLMCRLYMETEFHHIDQGLYVYRVHGKNTWLDRNQEIQENVFRMHDKFAEPMAMKWAERQGLRCIELGGAIASQKGYETVDRHDADIITDLDGTWPFEDNSVGVIRAYDIFEHLRDPIHTMKECYRVLAPGGWIFAQVPSTDGRGAWQDPTHISFWNENSWLYYSHANWAKYIGTPVKFQRARVYTTEKDARQVCWTVAHLISLKDGYRPPGIIEI